MKFQKAYERELKEIKLGRTENGSRYKEVRHLAIVNGQPELVLDKDKIDRYEFIQAYADSVNLNLLIEKFQKGNTEPLANAMRARPLYGDFSNAPDNLLDAFEKASKASDFIRSLTDDQRSDFVKDPEQFVIDFFGKEASGSSDQEGSVENNAD